MTRLRVAPVVEGDGKVQCVCVPLERLWSEIGGEFIEVQKPVYKLNSSLIQEAGLRKAVGIALEKLRGDESRAATDPELVLILLDADDDCPAALGPRISGWAKAVDVRADVACVLANIEYETWFVAAAASLIAGGYLRLKAGEAIPVEPEQSRMKQKWIEDRFVPRDARKHGGGVPAHGGAYNPPRDQAAMTRAMDLNACREGSPSFDKLCRGLEGRLVPAYRDADAS